MEQVRVPRARTELALGWGPPVRGCERATAGSDQLRWQYPPGAVVRAVRHSRGEHALRGGAVDVPQRIYLVLVVDARNFGVIRPQHLADRLGRVRHVHLAFEIRAGEIRS